MEGERPGRGAATNTSGDGRERRRTGAATNASGDGGKRRQRGEARVVWGGVRGVDGGAESEKRCVGGCGARVQARPPPLRHARRQNKRERTNTKTGRASLTAAPLRSQPDAATASGGVGATTLLLAAPPRSRVPPAATSARPPPPLPAPRASIKVPMGTALRPLLPAHLHVPPPAIPLREPALAAGAAVDCPPPAAAEGVWRRHGSGGGLKRVAAGDGRRARCPDGHRRGRGGGGAAIAARRPTPPVWCLLLPQALGAGRARPPASLSRATQPTGHGVQQRPRLAPAPGKGNPRGGGAAACASTTSPGARLVAAFTHPRSGRQPLVQKLRPLRAAPPLRVGQSRPVHPPAGTPPLRRGACASPAVAVE